MYSREDQCLLASEIFGNKDSNLIRHLCLSGAPAPQFLVEVFHFIQNPFLVSVFHPLCKISFL